VSLSLVRLDDRLIHGQVVVGWGQAIGAHVIVLVDDHVRETEWERELYAMGVPPGMEIVFASVGEAAGALPDWARSSRRVIVVVGDVDTLIRLCQAAPDITRVNLGGIHQQAGRVQRLPYVFLTDAEAASLRQLGERVVVTAQDVPSTAPVPLEHLL
jgi:PTS system mannose-specific IIB component/fructoselysine and glucoselysine-specific PTS system IIB component